MVKIPMPKPLKISLPTGGSIKSISDISKGIPTDCAMTFSLMVQIAPILASTECLMKVLKLLKPLIDVIKGLPMPPVKAIQEFAKAAADLAPCLLAPTPAAMIPFVKDLLCLILKFLKCFLGQMKSLVAIMNGIQLQMPKAGENDELRDALQCAQENAELQAQHLTTAIEPIGVILDLAGAFFDIAGVPPITIPTLPPGTDVSALNNVIQSVQAVVATIQVAADALGGCD
jgi:hypothetical protein